MEGFPPLSMLRDYRKHKLVLQTSRPSFNIKDFLHCQIFNMTYFLSVVSYSDVNISIYGSIVSAVEKNVLYLKSRKLISRTSMVEPNALVSKVELPG